MPARTRASVQIAIAVAGTATQSAAIELALEPFDREKVHGHRLELGVVRAAARAPRAGWTTSSARPSSGLHPDRAATIVAGIAMLVEVMRAFGSRSVEVSEHDILRGAALALAKSDGRT